MKHSQNLTNRLFFTLLFSGLLTAGVEYSALSMPVSSRFLSLSDGGGAVPAYQLGNNPAAMEADRQKFGVHYFSYPADVRAHQIQYTLPLAKGILGINFLQLDYGRFEDAVTGTTFNAAETVIRAGYKSVFRSHLSWGISAGFLRSHIDSYRSAAVIMNGGIRGRWMDNRLGVGLSFENAGRELSSYSNVEESLSPRYRVAAFYRPEHLSAVIFMDVVDSPARPSLFIAGMEFFPRPNITLRISSVSEKGELTYGDIGESMLAGLSMGFAVNYGNFRFETGIRNLGPAGTVTGVTFVMGW